MKTGRSITGFFVILLCGSLAFPLLAARGPAKARKPDPAASLFTNSTVLRIKIEIPERAMETLRKYHWQFGQQMDREDVRVTVREGQNVYTNVALHLKGAAGSFRDVDQNPAMTLHFDQEVPGQEFHGLTKLSLNNSVQDPTFVSEQFCRELFLQAGVPAPQATPVLVELNGRDLGLYVLVEGWDKHFLKRHFKKTGGNLYDGGFLKEITDELATNAGDHPKDQSDRVALAEAAKEPDLAKRLTRLERVLDLDRFLSFIALDIMLWDWDGYAMNKNNWRLFHDLDTDRMVFMPHGMDQMFWNPQGPILPTMQGLVARAALEIPSVRARYFERIKQLRSSVFVPERLTNRVQQITAGIQAALKPIDAPAAKEQERAASEFCGSIARRVESIDDQLAHPIVPLKFDVAGVAHLDKWEAKADFGFPELKMQPDATAPKSLELGTTRGSSIGSWRTRVWLEKGRYRVSGRVKIEGIVADPGDPRAGAGFRLLRQRPQNYTAGTADWHEISYEFPVDDPLGQVQIVCEFRGASGHAEFDLQSLRLEEVKGKPEPPAPAPGSQR